MRQLDLLAVPESRDQAAYRAALERLRQTRERIEGQHRLAMEQARKLRMQSLTRGRV